ncbi:aminotransferase class V-fold PLP-dependent enzyme, partial [Kitasatospora sp. NPDC127059]|uniref:aminotransferase class V-fold PLP-dependent enzyme n=1 Tax=Kitasatospora sp. NPDC127059 TaxID=3347120 RepID=UPI00365A4817
AGTPRPGAGPPPPAPAPSAAARGAAPSGPRCRPPPAPPDSPVQRREGIVTFRHRGIPSNDLGFVLASHGLMVRADGHCQARAGEADSSVRVSLHAYNSPEEIDRLLAVLRKL